MVTQKAFHDTALSFPETDKQLHADLIFFRVNKKFFATLNMPKKRCTLKFNAEFQDIFTAMGKGKIHAVPNAWGRLGWTTVELQSIDKEFIKDALLIAWRCTAPKKYQKLFPDWYKDEED
ncbi:MAG: MmcQ/YjbR family DNA-binding protein [Saprospiraceae bacterium]